MNGAAHLIVRHSSSVSSQFSFGRAVPLWILDLATGVFWVTKRNRELLGFSPDEVVTMERFLSVVHPEDRDLIRERVQAVEGSGDEDRVDYRIVRPDGSVGWVSSRGTTVVAWVPLKGERS